MNDNTSLPEKDLPPGRHRHLKEHLMREIRQTPFRRQRRRGPPAAASGCGPSSQVRLSRERWRSRSSRVSR